MIVRSESERESGRRSAGSLAIVLAMVVAAMSLVLASPLAAADIVDPNVTGFAATPSYVNLNMTTSVAVTLGSVRGGGLDDYLVTVTKPGGSGASAWYNFTAVGTISRQYGDAGADFATWIDEPGTYELRLDYFDGAAFTLAASSQLLATDELIVTTEAATASNEFTDVHNCPIAQEFQRGGEIIARAYVTYASTGDFVNGVPAGRGDYRSRVRDVRVDRGLRERYTDPVRKGEHHRDPARPDESSHVAKRVSLLAGCLLSHVEPVHRRHRVHRRRQRRAREPRRRGFLPLPPPGLEDHPSGPESCF